MEVALNVSEEEAKYLFESPKCSACDHLEVLHNDHCCEFCMVPGCKCKWGRIETKND